MLLTSLVRKRRGKRTPTLSFILITVFLMNSYKQTSVQNLYHLYITLSTQSWWLKTILNLQPWVINSCKKLVVYTSIQPWTAMNNIDVQPRILTLCAKYLWQFMKICPNKPFKILHYKPSKQNDCLTLSLKWIIY